MLSSIKLRIIGSLLRNGGPARIYNLFLHSIQYPSSKHALGGGIHIISRCNLKCTFCSYEMGPKKKFPDMDLATFESCLNSKIFKNVLYLYLGKGEPFLHGLLFQFTRELRRRGIVSLIPTNGLLIKSRIMELIESPPDILWVSLYDSHLPQQLEALSLLYHRKPKNLILGATRLINKDNLQDIKKFTDLLGPLGVENIWFQQYSLDGADTDQRRRRIYADDHRELAYIREISLQQRKRYPKLNCQYPSPIPVSPTKFRCLSLEKGPGIEPNGAIQPCCFIDPQGKDYYGNIFEDPLAHIKNNQYMKLKKSFNSKDGPEYKKCHLCPLLNLKV